jgi:hypothetical protein
MHILVQCRKASHMSATFAEMSLEERVQYDRSGYTYCGQWLFWHRRKDNHDNFDNCIMRIIIIFTIHKIIIVSKIDKQNIGRLCSVHGEMIKL